MSSPPTRTSPATLALGGQQSHHREDRVVLPQPDSPTSPIRSPSRERDVDALHGVQLAAAAQIEPDVQVPHIERPAPSQRVTIAADERAQPEAPHREMARPAGAG